MKTKIYIIIIMKSSQTHNVVSPIGIFDSGRGGYYTMEAIRKLLPQYDYLFYGDAAHMPYGGKTPEQIREYTFAGLQWLYYTGSLEIKACPWLADLIEEDLQTHFDDEKKKEIIRQYVGTSQAESVMLACTHYGVRYETFVQLFPDKIIIDPSQEAAKNLVDYLHRHPEIEKTLSNWWHVEEYWTKKL